MFTKRIVLLLTLNLALLLAIVALQVEVAEANPVALSWLPTSPDASQPNIAVQSPSQNQYYNPSNITLNFTVSKPESWFGNETFYGRTEPASYYCNGKIVSVQYVLDENPQNISVNDDNVLKAYDLPLNKTLIFSENLSLTKGKHLLSVHVSAVAYYMPSDNWDVNSHGGIIVCEMNEIVVDSNEITFYVVDTDKPALELPSVTLIGGASVVSVAGVAIGLLYYHKKRQHSE
jgi:hypothetical protein